MSDLLSKIRVLIVDDYAMVRSGLAFFLQAYPDMELAGEASNGIEAVQMYAETQPDVVLMDLNMPEMDGTQAIRQIKYEDSAVRVIALTSFKEQELVRAALQAGAVGYIQKDVTADELASAIRAASIRVVTLSNDATQALVLEDEAKKANPAAGNIELTGREREILALLVERLSNQEIAEQLKLSRNTVKYYIRSILIKLKVKRRSEAVALALQHQLGICGGD